MLEKHLQPLFGPLMHFMVQLCRFRYVRYYPSARVGRSLAMYFCKPHVVGGYLKVGIFS